jgi:hypothetical protein
MHMLLSPFPQVPPRLPSESDDRYPAIRLNNQWRIITCRDRVQWVLQSRRGPGDLKTLPTAGWRNRSYCRSLAALLRCCCEHDVGPIEPAASAALAALPDRIGGGL